MDAEDWRLRSDFHEPFLQTESFQVNKQTARHNLLLKTKFQPDVKPEEPDIPSILF